MIVLIVVLQNNTLCAWQSALNRIEHMFAIIFQNILIENR